MSLWFLNWAGFVVVLGRSVVKGRTGITCLRGGTSVNPRTTVVDLKVNPLGNNLVAPVGKIFGLLLVVTFGISAGGNLMYGIMVR